MHDPLTVAFEIRPLGITIWHKDPEKRGDDDSCDWHGHHRPLNPREKALEEAIFNMETTLDNRPHFPDSREHKEYQLLKAAAWQWKHRSPWRVPVRWHFWHWRLQVNAILSLKRWLFSRCAGCGGRFSWGYCPCSTSWNSGGPRWFRGEPHTYHSQCVPPPKVTS